MSSLFQLGYFALGGLAVAFAILAWARPPKRARGPAVAGLILSLLWLAWPMVSLLSLFDGVSGDDIDPATKDRLLGMAIREAVKCCAMLSGPALAACVGSIFALRRPPRSRPDSDIPTPLIGGSP